MSEQKNNISLLLKEAYILSALPLPPIFSRAEFESLVPDLTDEQKNNILPQELAKRIKARENYTRWYLESNTARRMRKKEELEMLSLKNREPKLQELEGMLRELADDDFREENYTPETPYQHSLPSKIKYEKEAPATPVKKYFFAQRVPERFMSEYPSKIQKVLGVPCIEFSQGYDFSLEFFNGARTTKTDKGTILFLEKPYSVIHDFDETHPRSGAFILVEGHLVRLDPDGSNHYLGKFLDTNK